MLSMGDNLDEIAYLPQLRVIAKARRPWGGCVDGMNEEGLVASVTFGGGCIQHPGFSIILMIRYVLETYRRVSDAVEALCRIPVALSQNVTALDRPRPAAGHHPPQSMLGPMLMKPTAKIPKARKRFEISLFILRPPTTPWAFPSGRGELHMYNRPDPGRHADRSPQS